MNRGVASCYNAKTGERVYERRLASGEAVAEDAAGGGGPGPGGFGGRGPGGRGGFGGGGRGMGDDYPSPVIAAGKLYYTSKSGKFYVVDAKPEYNLLSTNDLSTDTSGFDGTPAISDGEIFVRSNAALYCISDKQ